MHLNPKHLSLNNLLNGRLFRIPDYQRSYAWSKKQRDDLFDDIVAAKRSGQDHFMATMICLAREVRQIHADEYQEFEVVDGQQRLTTLIILLKSIEKRLNSDDPIESSIKRQIAELLIKGDDFSIILLQTNHDRSGVFAEYIRTGSIKCVEEVGTASEKNLVDATNECEEFLTKWSQNFSLVDLVALLRNRLSLLFHQITDEASVYRVFEVLNSRGLDVRWIDKLKSQLMALIFTHADSGARTNALSEMKEKWEEIYRTLGLRSDLGDEALRFAGTWRSTTRPNRLLSQEDATSTLTTAAGSRIASIAATGDWLKSVVVAVHGLDANIRLRAVTRIAHARFLATAILLRKFPKDVETRLLGNWERVTFRIFGLSGADTRYKVGDYIRLGYDAITENLSEHTIQSRLNDLGKGYSIDEILPNIDWSECYHGWTEELRYLLFRYDEYLTSKNGGPFNNAEWNKIWHTDPSKSIEHIMPQSSNHEFVHHLGNLTMLPPNVNSMLQDREPHQKAEVYRQCGLRGTVQAADLIGRRKGAWDTKKILARAKLLETFIRSEWD